MTEEQKCLAEKNYKLIFSFLARHNLSEEEWFGIAAIGFCNAVISYNKDNCAFSTYAYRCMYNEFSKEWNRMQRQGEIPKDRLLYYDQVLKTDESESLLDFIPSDENTEAAAIEKVLVSEVLQKCKSTLSERDYYIFCLFLQGITYREIAKRTGVSRAMVGKVITKTLNMIKHL